MVLPSVLAAGEAAYRVDGMPVHPVQATVHALAVVVPPTEDDRPTEDDKQN